MRKSYTLLFILFCFQLVTAKELTLSFSWNHPKVINDTKELSLQFHEFEINNNSFDILYSFPFSEEVESIDILNNSFRRVSSKKNIGFHNKDISVSWKSVSVRKKKYLKLIINGIRLGDSKNSLELLTEIQLKINSSPAQQSFKSSVKNTSSILETGNWIKIGVNKTGVYKLSYEQLKQAGISSPGNVSLYGMNGEQLSYINTSSSLKRLEQIPIHFEKGSDGVFGSGDYIWMFLNNSNTFKWNDKTSSYEFKEHDFSDSSYYFLSSDYGSPKSIPSIPQTTKNTDYNSKVYDYIYHHEVNDTNLLKSGRIFFGESFKTQQSRNFTVQLQNLSSEEGKIRVQAAARSANTTSLAIKVNNQNSGTIIFNKVSTGSYTSRYADLQNRTYSFTQNANLDINLTYSSSSSDAWLDYYQLFLRKKLIKENQALIFQDYKTFDKEVSSFQVESGKNLIFWDVSEFNNIKRIETSSNSFKIETNNSKRFVAFTSSDLNTPTILGKINNQNLSNIDIPNYVIVTAPLLSAQANELANIHKSNDNLDVFVVTPQTIYNEYSSGTADVSAIRNFFRDIYNRDTNNKFKYALLLGDGNYNNKTIVKQNNHILNYQSLNSIDPTSSFVSDDFYGLLDESEGEYSGAVDIGIGRLPVSSVTSAQTAINKIKAYINSEPGSWQNDICFVADDADDDQTMHMTDADSITRYVDKHYPNYNIDKVYMDAYKQYTTSGGQTYPDVNKTITEKITKGSLIFNYSGHGGEEGLAHEKILTIEEIRKWENLNKLSIFMTATCEFSRFDDPVRVSAGEEVFLNPKGGGIALLTTTRVVYTNPNFKLNSNFYKYVFNTDSDGNPYRLGDIIRLTKASTNSDINKRNFTLLGDPALKLNYGQKKVITKSINDIEVSEFKDTVKALQVLKIDGFISNTGTDTLKSFNGFVIPSIFDKPKEKVTLSNDGATPMEYKLQKNILYKGKVEVTNGTFSFSCMIPKDISYQPGRGKISYFAYSNTDNASGAYNQLAIGGYNSNGEDDDKGPQIELYFNDENFKSGNYTNQNPILYAKLSDDNGINTSGNGIGHDITAFLDSDYSKPFILNDYYTSDLNSYKSGSINFPMFDIAPGKHTLSLKAWDIHNNSSIQTIDFIVEDKSNILIPNIWASPNPVKGSTNFYFEHNLAKEVLSVEFEIFDATGRIIQKIPFNNFSSDSFTAGPFEWNIPTSGKNISQGIYFYRVVVRSENGKKISKSEKLVIL